MYCRFFNVFGCWDGADHVASAGVVLDGLICRPWRSWGSSCTNSSVVNIFLGMIVGLLHNKFKESGNKASFTLAEVANKLCNYVKFWKNLYEISMWRSIILSWRQGTWTRFISGFIVLPVCNNQLMEKCSCWGHLSWAQPFRRIIIVWRTPFINLLLGSLNDE